MNLTDLNWGGMIVAFLGLLGAGIAGLAGVIIARTNREATTSGEHIRAASSEVGELRQIVTALSNENRVQRDEMQRHREVSVAYQATADTERRTLAMTVLSVRSEMAAINSHVQQQTALLFAIDQEAKRLYPQQWAEIIARVSPQHRDALLLIVPIAPGPVLPDGDPATDPTS